MKSYGWGTTFHIAIPYSEVEMNQMSECIVIHTSYEIN